MSCGKVFLGDKIAKRIDKSIRSKDGQGLGYLVGYEDGLDVHAVGAVAVGEAAKLVTGLHRASLLLPSGLTIVGIFIKTKGGVYRVIVEQLCKMVFPEKLKDTLKNEKIVVYAAELEEGGESAAYWYDLNSNTAEAVQLQSSALPPLQSSLVFRLKANVELQFRQDNNPDKQQENIVIEMYALRARLLCPDTLYRIDDTAILVNGDGGTAKGMKLPYKPDASVKDLLSAANIWEKFGKKKNGCTMSELAVNVSIVEDLTGDPPISCTPVIHHKHETFTLAKLPLSLDVICYVHDCDKASVWSTRLRESLDRQLEAITNCVLAYCPTGKSLHSPVPYHFLPQPLHHVFTVIYPQNVADEKLADRRRSLQLEFLLPATRPYTKPLNAHSFPDDARAGGYLSNVHVGLPSSGVADGSEHLVDGTYHYHHYMQDRINDDGWGCAYRSLQTIVSWFRLQGYTEKPVPTHSQIQQILVDIGDKPAKFVNSRQWIGSMEVSYVLSTLLEVESKTLFVSSGAELANKGRELAQHFDKQGSPIMIGGGVLAHTILGVSFNDSTGELKFLILDPHYTGGEDLKVIQDKGWCGWKGTNFWDQNAYYNLCMPQIPAMV